MRVLTSGVVPLDKIVAFLIFFQPQEQCRDKITNSHVIPATEAKHIHKVLKRCVHCIGCLDLQKGFDQRKSTSHVRSRFQDAPKVTHPLLKDIGGRRKITRVGAQFLLFKVQSFPGFLDGIAHAFVVTPIRYLVVSAAIRDDFATLAPA